MMKVTTICPLVVEIFFKCGRMKAWILLNSKKQSDSDGIIWLFTYFMIIIETKQTRQWAWSPTVMEIITQFDYYSVYVSEMSMSFGFLHISSIIIFFKFKYVLSHTFWYNLKKILCLDLNQTLNLNLLFSFQHQHQQKLSAQNNDI